jgi:ribosomal protein S18 acetylase RimI-like enzyme
VYEPNRATIRPARAGDVRSIAAVHVASWRETYSGLLPEATLARLSVADREIMWSRNLPTDEGAAAGDVFVVDAGGRVVGFASIGLQRDESLAAEGLTGEILAIYVLAAEKGRGLGRRLLHHCALALREHGHAGAALRVLDGNAGALGFYRRFGAEDRGARREDAADGSRVTLALGWRSVEDLAAATA